MRSPASRRPERASTGRTGTAPSSSRQMAHRSGSPAGPRARSSGSTSIPSVGRERTAAPEIASRGPRRDARSAGVGLALEAALVLRAQPLQLLGIETHAQGEPHLSQDGLDLVQRLLAEVLGLEQLRLRLLHEVGDGANARGLETVGGAHGQLELIDIAEEMLVELDAWRVLDPGLADL